jgi:protease IV
MKRLTPLLLLCLAAPGCLRPFRTDSKVSFSSPLRFLTTLELEPKSTAPLVEMTVAGPACGGKAGKVALLDVEGLLVNANLTGPYSAGENPIDLFREKLDAAADPCVCAVVLRLNSPGGSVVASDLMWQELQRFRARTQRPVVACLMDVGTGGAYYLATAADLIVAHPMTVTGGVGVVLNLYNLQDALQVFSIRSQSVQAGANTDMGTLLKPLTPEAKQLLQTMADEFHERFKAVVRQQRPQVQGDDDTFDGRVFTARQALERKLIDRIGYLDDAIDLARQLGGRGGASVVLYHRCNDPGRTPYATTPNTPLQYSLLPVSIPGVERSRLPTFLYLWAPDPTLERLGGK